MSWSREWIFESEHELDPRSMQESGLEPQRLAHFGLLILECHSKDGSVVQKTQETQIQSLGQEDPLEEGMAAHSSIPAGKNLTNRGCWRVMVHGVRKSWTRLKCLSTHARSHGPL